MIWVTNILVWSYDYADLKKIIISRNFVANFWQLYNHVMIATLLSYYWFTINLPRSCLSYEEFTKSQGHWVNFCWFICHLFTVFCHWRHVYVIREHIALFNARRSVSKHKWHVNNSNFRLFWLAAIFNYENLTKKLGESYETLRWVSKINLRIS